MDKLTQNQKLLVEKFNEITQSSIEIAINCLKRNDWRKEISIEKYFLYPKEYEEKTKYQSINDARKLKEENLETQTQNAKQEVKMNDKDSDPFSYTPMVKRRKFSTQPIKKERPISQKSTTTPKDKKSSGVTKNKSRKTFSKINQSKSAPNLSKKVLKNKCAEAIDIESVDANEVCSICQMPFNLLMKWESREVHASNCLELAIEKMPPCDMGIHCDNTIRNHYAQFNHNELAKNRTLIARDKEEELPNSPVLFYDDFLPESTSDSRDPEMGQSSVNLSPSSCQIGSNQPKDTEKLKEFATRKVAQNNNDKNDTSSSLDIFNGDEDPKVPEFQVQPKTKTIDNILKGPISNGKTDTLDSTTSTEPANSFDSIGISDKSAPLKISANKDSHGDYRIKVSVNPKVELKQFEMRIKDKKDEMKECDKCIGTDCQHQTQRIKVKSVITPKKSEQVTLNSYFKVTESISDGANPGCSLPASSRNTKNDAFHTMMQAQKQVQIQQKQPVAKSNAYKLNDAIPRKCPFYKKIPGTSFVVDAFSYGIIPGVTKYFLSHFHYDHYTGLRKNFCYRIICSRITANLVRQKIGVDSKYITTLELDEPTIIEGVEVTLLDANHCPGSVMFLFKVFSTQQILLHCGDFRACPAMEEYPSLWNNRIDKVYLDTTYCKPEYDFPNQADALTTSIELIHQHLQIYPKTLIVCGTYTIGKERVFLAIAEEFDYKIWPTSEKKRILRALENDIILKRLSDTPHNASIHLMEMGKVKNFKYLNEYLEKSSSKYNHILSIIPTGWTHQKGSTAESSLKNMRIKTFKGNLSQLEIPYSEHSSFSELKRFVKFLKLPSSRSVIPTVNVANAKTREDMTNHFQNWIAQSSNNTKL